MSVIKCTAVFQMTTGVGNEANVNQRTGGWSESFYFEGTMEQAKSEFHETNSWCGARAACLPKGASIIGQRYQIVDTTPIGKVLPFAKLFPGESDLQSDTPWQSLLIRCPATNAAYSRGYIMRCLPDFMVVTGEFMPNPSYQKAVAKLIRYLKGFRIKVIDKSKTNFNVGTVSAAGLVTTGGPHTIPAGGLCHITRTYDTSRRVHSGTFPVVSVTGTTLTIGGWVGGDTRLGKVRELAYIYPTIDETASSIEKVITRKVGRPSSAFRGRQHRPVR